MGLSVYDTYMEIKPVMPTYTAEQCATHRDYYTVRNNTGKCVAGVMFSTLKATYIDTGATVYIRTADDDIIRYN